MPSRILAALRRPKRIATSLPELRYLVFEGMKGDTGDSAYEEAVQLGFEGTEEEWLASLKGEQGEPGKAKSAYLDYDVVRLIEDDSIYTSATMWSDIDNGVVPLIYYISAENVHVYFELDYGDFTGATPIIYFRSKTHLLSVDSTGHFTLTDRAQGGGNPNAVLYTPQSLSDSQKAQARTNVGAGTYSKPSGGIPASDLASGVIPSVPQMATDPNMSDWTSGKTVDAAVLKNGVQHIEGVVADKPDYTDIPTNTSQLTNDSGFVEDKALGIPFESLTWRSGMRYNMKTGELESRAASTSIGKFSLQDGKYRIASTIGRLIYADLLEWDEDGNFVSSRETNANVSAVIFCANPKHYYAINLNDSRNTGTNTTLAKIADGGNASFALPLGSDGITFTDDSSGNVYADITSRVTAALPDVSQTTLNAHIDRVSGGVTLWTDGALTTQYHADGVPSFQMSYFGGNACLLKVEGFAEASDANAFFAENPTTLTVNGDDQTHYLRNKADYTKELAEELAGAGYQTAQDVQTAISGVRQLPTVTASDNGKFLRVVNGAWAAATVPAAESNSFGGGS